MRCVAMVLIGALGTLQPPQGQAPQSPSFRSGVQVLEVDARVFDRQGHFVKDLLASDFEVYENGVAQKIETFFLVGGTAPSAARADAAKAPAAPQTWIFIFDHRHLLPGGFKRAHVALEKFIAERFRAGDLAGIVDRDKMVNNRITSVREEILAAVRKVKVPGAQASRDADAAAARQATDSAIDEADLQIAAALSTMSAAEIKRDARSAIETIDELVTGLATMYGPKTIVYFSNGYGLTDLEGTLRTVVGRASRAGARIYAVDTRGLAGGPTDTLNSLSIDTGGLMIFNENNMGRALDVVAADSNVYYVLGYQPLNRKYDGKFRNIEVKVKRPHVTVRSRKGYLAIDPRKMNVARPVR